MRERGSVKRGRAGSGGAARRHAAHDQRQAARTSKIASGWRANATTTSHSKSVLVKSWALGSGGPRRGAVEETDGDLPGLGQEIWVWAVEHDGDYLAGW